MEKKADFQWFSLYFNRAITIISRAQSLCDANWIGRSYLTMPKADVLSILNNPL